LTSIGGEAANSRTLTAMRAKLRDSAAGTKLRVERVRDGKKETVELVLADRI
jgi:S1-C subfamily serine protease